eukprot:10927479-Lingulodinium_polyedra.AAC.1
MFCAGVCREGATRWMLSQRWVYAWALRCGAPIVDFSQDGRPDDDEREGGSRSRASETGRRCVNG